ncbi:MAG: SpoIIE family protein phosphatase [candidate division NC10 bacterium]|nr:SpoIIE family protein phosphatase [candidate division NC10 bacterium]
METVERPVLEWGLATLALPGHPESGDRHVVQPFPNGVLVAAVDGLGHGEEAAAAAKLAVSVLERHAREGVIALLRRCDEALRGTRGVVMSLASFRAPDGMMTWLGVGNVEGLLVRAAAQSDLRHEALVLRGGVVGRQLPPLQAAVVPVRRGDMLILATDGIREGFTEGLPPNDPPQGLADRILARHSKGTDDALVLVARYAGWGP